MSWLSDLIQGVAGVTGQEMTNRANLKIAREQMAFQERMSSTAAQRSAKDYELAGLNPALAYDRPASSPGGASAVMGDSLGAGIATAMAARKQRAELKVMAETARTAKATADVEANPGVVRERTEAARHEARARAGVAGITYDNAWRDAEFQRALQPLQLRSAALDNIMKAYSFQGLTRTAIEKLMPHLVTGAPAAAKAISDKAKQLATPTKWNLRGGALERMFPKVGSINPEKNP